MSKEGEPRGEMGEGTQGSEQYDLWTYVREKGKLDELVNPEKNKEGVQKTVSFWGTLTNINEGLEINPYVDEIVTRGPDFVVTTKAGKDRHSGPNPPTSPEEVSAYDIFARKGNADGWGMTIRTKERSLAMDIHNAVVAKYNEVGSMRHVLEWLMETPWRKVLEF
ncbi:MAG: hypothetical protein HY459_03845 [Parcubacteria group bacterium]|nr:hypothetical protein [Parcubacteria group bacterium]